MQPALRVQEIVRGPLLVWHIQCSSKRPHSCTLGPKPPSSSSDASFEASAGGNDRERERGAGRASEFLRKSDSNLSALDMETHKHSDSFSRIGSCLGQKLSTR